MKIIDLLNKIAKGEEVPKKIKYDGNLYFYCKPCNIYEIDGNDDLCGKDLYNMLDNLNDEVEIIEEEKEISKITKEEFERLDKRTLLELIVKNQNELIDEVKKLKEDK